MISSKENISSIRFVLLVTALNANIIAFGTFLIFAYISIRTNRIEIDQIAFLILALLGTSITGKVAQKGFEKGGKNGNSTETNNTEQVQ